MSFPAKFNSACASPRCDRQISAGDIVVFVDQDLYHDECAADTTLPEPIQRHVCTSCFTEVSVSGACSC